MRKLKRTTKHIVVSILKEVRVVDDYRLLNKNTDKNKYPLNFFSGTKDITSLDLDFEETTPTVSSDLTTNNNFIPTNNCFIPR